jgi:hypothetical protein
MSRRRSIATFLLVLAGFAASAQSATSFGNFEDNSLANFGTLTNSGFQTWAPPVSAQVVTASASALTGSKVLELNGNAAFNFGQANGAALGFNFVSANLRNDWLANNAIEFDWVAVPNNSPSGFSQLFNIIMNSQGGGFTNIAGSNAGTPNTQQFYFTGYNGNALHVVASYQNYKNTVLASANPNGGGWLEFGIQPNAGGGAPGQMWFDNFQLTTIPEPASLGMLAMCCVGLLRRRK